SLPYSTYSCRVSYYVCFFFFTATATTEIYTLSLHDALPIWLPAARGRCRGGGGTPRPGERRWLFRAGRSSVAVPVGSIPAGAPFPFVGACGRGSAGRRG